MSLKPKALLYRDALATAEQRIVETLPELFEGLVARARSEDTQAATVLLDRIMGRADDHRPPYTEDAFRLDQQLREEDDELRRWRAGCGVRKGA
jgi:hypothetical protein